MPYLRFDNLDLKQTFITAHCSICEKKFSDEVTPGERMDDALLRIRQAYEGHMCVLKL